MLFLNSWRVSSHIVRYDTGPPAIQKYNDTREKLRLNFHSFSVSVLLEYGRIRPDSTTAKFQSREIVSGKYGWLHMSDSIEFRFRSEQN
jgi:hypothetical protein